MTSTSVQQQQASPSHSDGTAPTAKCQFACDLSSLDTARFNAHHLDILNNNSILITNDAQDLALRSFVRSSNDFHLDMWTWSLKMQKLGTYYEFNDQKKRTLSPRNICHVLIKSIGFFLVRGPRRNAIGIRVAIGAFCWPQMSNVVRAAPFFYWSKPVAYAWIGFVEIVRDQIG